MSVEPHKPLFDAEGVEFDMDVAVGDDVLPCRTRCLIGFGYTSYYAVCEWVRNPIDGSQLDLDRLGFLTVTAIERQALALWATKP